MKLKWLLPLLVVIDATEITESAQLSSESSALSKYQQKRLERKQKREEERQRKRALRRKERLDRIAIQKEKSQEKSKKKDAYQNDQRFVNTEFIQKFKYEHDEDDILYSPNYAVFMAKSGADISDIPIEADKKNSSTPQTARAAGIPGIINLWDKYIDSATGRYQVPFAFEPKFDDWGRSVVRDTMSLIESEMPCLMFVDANPRLHRDYLYFMQSRGCHSYVGRITGAQPLYLDIPCQRVGVATHEIFHALGFHHEHQRIDRDKYIRVEWDSIKQTGCGANRNVGCGIYFQKLKFTQSNNSPYDYISVMHYDGYAFSSKPGVKPTITGRDGTVFRAQRIKASTEDIRQLCGLYNCSKCGLLPGSKESSCDTAPYTTFERRVCDGFQDCIDGRDEKQCTSCNGDRSWQCKDHSQCIRTEQRCDGWSDCNDGSDEHDCTATCCKKLSLAGIAFTKLNQEVNGRPVYYSSASNKYVSFSYEDSTWNLGPEPGNNVADVLAISGKICPEQVEEPWYQWNQYGGLKPCCFSTCLDNVEPPEDTPRPCENDPCENGASCEDDGYDFTCKCQNGYYGNRCQNKSSACVGNPCQNGGKCVTNGASYTCECPLMYFGPQCQFGCEHPGKFFNVADNVSFKCADRVCRFTCSDEESTNYNRPVVCFCSSGQCRWYPSKIVNPSLITCPASTPKSTEEPEIAITVAVAAVTETTTTQQTPPPATPPKRVTAKKTTTVRTTTTSTTTTTTTTRKTTTKPTTTTTLTTTTKRRRTTRRPTTTRMTTTEAAVVFFQATTTTTKPNKKGERFNQCPHPRNKLHPDVKLHSTCAKQSIWSKNYNCKLYCDQGSSAVSEMRCRCRTAKLCSWWARKIRGKVTCL